jgi:hypothetical protein
VQAERELARTLARKERDKPGFPVRPAPVTTDMLFYFFLRVCHLIPRHTLSFSDRRREKTRQGDDGAHESWCAISHAPTHAPTHARTHACKRTRCNTTTRSPDGCGWVSDASIYVHTIYTHTLSLALSLALSLSRARARSLSLSLSRARALSLSLSLSRARSLAPPPPPRPPRGGRGVSVCVYMCVYYK